MRQTRNLVMGVRVVVAWALAFGNAPAAFAKEFGVVEDLYVGRNTMTPYGGLGRYENALVQSEAFGTTWTNSGLTITDGETGPDGGTSADKLANSGAAAGYAEQVVTPSGNATDYVFSVWLKAGDVTGAELKLTPNGTGPVVGTQTLTLTTSWQRYSVKATTGSSGTTTLTARLTNTSTLSAKYLYAWGAQVEKASAPGVYAKTTTAAISASRGLVASSGGLLFPDGTLQTTSSSTTVSGLANYVSKFTSANVIGNSQIYDTGTAVGIGTTAPGAKLEIGSGQIATPLGSAGAPSYAFSGDLNTGIYSSGADAVSVVTGGTERLGMNSVGEVSIARNFKVDGVGYSNAIGGAFDGAAVLAVYAGLTNMTPLKVRAASGQTADLFQWANAGNTVLGVIDKNGNVGIGTTAPQSRLQVTGGGGSILLNPENTATQPLAGQPWFRVGGPSGNGIMVNPGVSTEYTYLSWDKGAGVRFGDGASSPVMTVESNGNVGIGTTGPNALLSLGAAVSNSKLFLYESGNIRVGLGANGGMMLTIPNTTGNSNAFKFSTISTSDGTTLSEKMRITDDGNVGIGTTGPGAKLQVSGAQSAAFTGTDMGIVNIIATSGTDNLPTKLTFMNTNSNPLAAIGVTSSGAGSTLRFGTTNNFASGITNTALLIDPSGNVGIGTTGPGALLHLNSNSDTVLRIESTSVTDGQIARLWTFVPAGSADSRVLQIRGHSGATFKGGFNVNKDGSTLIFNDNSVGITVASGSAGNVGIGTTGPVDRLQVATLNTPVGLGEFEGANLLFNGGAEDGTTGWTSRDFGIDVGAGSGGSSSNDPFSGLNNFYGQNDGGMNLAVAVIPGGVYTYSGRVRVDQVNSVGDASAGRLVVGTTATGRELVDQYCDPNTYDVTPNLNKWMLCSATFTAPATADVKTTTIYVGFRGEGNTHRTDFDNLSLVRGGLAGSYSPITTAIGTGATTAISGNVGIGTTAPGQKLEVAGSIKLTGAGTGITFNDGTTQTTSSSTTVSGTANYVSKFTSANVIGNSQIYDTGTNVGIGTTGPNAKLHIVGANDLDYLLIDKGTGTNGIKFTFDGTNFVSFIRTFESATLADNYMSFGVSQGNNTTESEKLRIKGDGNVGIGTTNPSQRLQVYSTTAGGANLSLYDDSLDANSTPSLLFGVYHTNGFRTDKAAMIKAASVASDKANLYFGTYGSGVDGATPKMTLQWDGNVGIGTTGPNTDLQISKAGETVGLRLSADAAQQAEIVLQKGGVDKWYLRSTASSNDLDFYSATLGGPAVTFQGGGNVGIGTTGPLGTLHIQSSDAFTQLVIEGTGTNAPAKMNFKSQGLGAGLIQVQGSTKVAIDTNGNVGIGTTTPGEELHLSGTNDVNLKITSNAVDVAYLGDNGGTNDGILALKNSSGTTNVFIRAGSDSYLTGGNVGIGTTGPAKPLHVVSGSEATFRLEKTGANASYLNINVADNVQFDNSYTAGTELNLRYNGNVCVGLVDCLSKLGVSGNAAIGTTYAGGTAAPANGLIVEGNVGIGTTSPAQKLHIGAGQVLTDSATNISYAAGDYLIYSDDPEVGIVDDATDSNYKLMKTFRAAKSGTLRIKWQAYIQSGTYYWAYKIAKNNGATTLVGPDVPFTTCDDGTCDVHAYEQFTDDVSGVTAGDLIELWMVSSSAGGVPQAGNGQTLYAKDFRMYSASPSTEWAANNIWGANVGIGTTAPGQKLEVAGSIKLTGAGTGITFNDGTTQTTSSSTTVSGTANYVSKFTSANVIGNSQIYDTGTNVGIGTTGPGAKLHVEINSATTYSANTDAGNANRILFRNTNTTANTMANLALISNAGGGSSLAEFKAIGKSANVADLAVQLADGANFRDVMYLQSSGNVGIGTISPGRLLELAPSSGDAYIQLTRPSAAVQATLGFNTGATNDWLIRTITNSDLNIYSYGTASNVLTIAKATGNVGIGTTVPGAKLTVHTGTAGDGIRISTVDGASDDNAPLSWYVVSTGHETAAITGEYPNSGGGGYGRLLFKTRDAGTLAEKMRIDSNGNVGIGTTNPDQKLVVQGIANIRSDGTWLNFNDSTNSTNKASIYNSGGNLRLDTNTGVHFLIMPGSSGNVGIGTTSPGNRLHVVGGAQATTIKTDGFVEDVSGKLARNLVTSNGWTVSSGSIGGFSQNGDTAENVREWGVGPHGQRAILWTSGANDVTSDGDGGWNFGGLPVDDTKTYRVSVWIKKTGSTDGTTYLGCDTTNTNNLDGTANANPYFWNGDLPVLGRWYLLVGYLHGSGDADTTSAGGIYDGTTGEKVISMTDFKNKPGITTQTHRSYLYYDVTTSDKQYWWDPRVEEVNGTEPSLGALLGLNPSTTGGGWTDGGTSVYLTTTSDNVGIGTTGPNSALHVAANGGALTLSQSGNVVGNTPKLQFATTNTAARGYIQSDAVVLGDMKIQTEGGQALMLNPTSGNVGIGTTGPGHALHVRSTVSQDGIIVETTGSYPEIRFDRSAVAKGYLGIAGTAGGYAAGTLADSVILRSENATIHFITSGSNLAMTINAGNVGIGTTGPIALLNLAKTSAPTTITRANEYLHIGSGENTVNSYRLMGFGFTTSALTNTPAYIGYQEISTAANTYGDLVFGTRNVTTDTTPSERMRIDASGNIGIGTTGPSGLLHTQKLANDSNHIFDIYSANNGHVPQIQFRRSLQDTVGFTANTTGSLLGALQFYGVNSGNTAFARAAEIRVIQDGSAGSTYPPGAITFLTSPGGTTNQSERVRIDSAGNVGIGTTNPGAKLQVDGNVLINSNLNIANSGMLQIGGQQVIDANKNLVFIGSTAAGEAHVRAASGANLQLEANAATTGHVTIATSGNVGIGTTGPAGKLDLRTSGTTDVDVVLQSGVQNMWWLSADNSSNTLLLGGDGGTRPADSAFAIAIDGSQNVGIGTTGPGQKLSVAGTFGVLEGGVSPSLYTIFQGGDQAANITYTLPTAQGGASTVLTNDGAGVLSWAAGGGSQTPWTSDINAAGFTLFGNSTASGNLRLDSTSNATKGYVLLNPSGGNVGIGVTTPQTKLEVAGDLGTPFGGFGRYENALVQSEAFGTTWTNSGLTITDGETGPDGGTSADKLANSGAAAGYAEQVVTPSGNSTDYVFSVWLKAGDVSGAELKLTPNGTGPVVGTQTLTLTTSWQRYSVKATTGSSGTTTLTARLTNTSTTTAKYIYAWGAQVEKASAPGVYAKTGANALTGTSRGLVANAGLLASGDLQLESPTGGNVQVVALRGTATNAAIRWNETTDQWEFTNDGSTYTPLAGAGGGWYQEFTATGGQTAFTLTAGTYNPGSNELLVFYNGVLQQAGASNDYVETNSTTITFNTGRVVADKVIVMNKTGLSTSNTVTLAPSSATPDSSANASIFINDTGGGNLLQFQTGGADKFVVNNSGVLTTNLQVTGAGPHYVSTGNVGIGTTGPGNKLTVGSQSGQSNANIAARAGNANSFEWGHGNTAGYGSTLGYQSGTGVPFIAFNAESGTTANTYQTRGIKGAILKSDLAGGFIFSTAATATADNQTETNLVSILTGGNVGIGTTSPSTRLHVQGTDNTTGAFPVAMVSDTTAMAANVGGGIGFQGTYTAAGAYATYGAVKAGKDNATDGNYNGYLSFWTQPGSLTERMRITSAGNVGIGTTNPVTKLAIQGNDTTGFIRLVNDTPTTGKDYRIYTGDTGTFGIRNVTSGNTLVNIEGTADGNSTYLAFYNAPSATQIWVTGIWYPYGGNSYVVANGGATGVSLGNGSTSWSALSDERAKNIYGDIENNLGKIAHLRHVYYKFKSEEDAGSEAKMRVGVVAQDVLKVLPEVVDLNEATGMLDVRYTELIPVLIGGIQELDQKVASQQQEIEELKNELSELRGN